MDTKGERRGMKWETGIDMYTLLMPCAAAAAKSLQSCPTLCDPIDSSPLGSPVPGILQARVLEWVAISLTRPTFVGKVMPLLFNMLSRLVITFLPRSKLLLISWLQSQGSFYTKKGRGVAVTGCC